jgi:deoxyribonuclease V
VAFEAWPFPAPTRVVTSHCGPAADYEPGHFYRRELPCLLALLDELGGLPRCIVVDGYVFLDGHSRPGLGKHLFDALDGQVAVVGVAKSAFAGIGPEHEVLRGASHNPLYVTCVGMDLADAKAGVLSMHGEHRIPTLLRLVDRVCREG